MLPRSSGIFFSGRKQRNSAKHSYHFATWNVRKLLDTGTAERPARRTALLAAELQRYNIDIAALSETRLADEGSLTEVAGGYTFFWKGLPPDLSLIHI